MKYTLAVLMFLLAYVGGAEEIRAVQLDLAMIDAHGCPTCTAEAKVDGAWTTVSEGVWKPRPRPWSSTCASATGL